MDEEGQGVVNTGEEDVEGQERVSWVSGRKELV